MVGKLNANSVKVSLALTGMLAGADVMASFVEDSKATLGMRNFYINSDFRDGVGSSSKSEEWAQGLMLRFESGFTEGPVGFGVNALGLVGIKLDGGRGRHPGGSMIPDDTDGDGVGDWSRLGLTAKLRVSNTELRYGTLTPRLPILVATDARLLPQTFEGFHLISHELEGLTLHTGWIDKAVGRASTNRTGLAVVAPAAGNRESDGLFFAGADYALSESLNAQYYYSNLDDYYTQNFVGLQHLWPLADEQSLKADFRYFRTRSDGANSSASGRAAGYVAGGYTRDGSGEIDNDTWSFSLTYNHAAHTLTGGYQQVSGGSNFIQPNQGGLGEGAIGAAMYLATDRFVGQFNRAGERTSYALYSYDFSAVGIPGLTSTLAYYSGDSIKTPVGGGGKEWERDVLVDYVIQSGTLKNLGFGWRNITYRGNVQRDQDENRLIISYTIPLL